MSNDQQVKPSIRLAPAGSSSPPAAKRPRVPLKFSIESIMQPYQQQNHHHKQSPSPESSTPSPSPPISPQVSSRSPSPEPTCSSTSYQQAALDYNDQHLFNNNNNNYHHQQAPTLHHRHHLQSPHNQAKHQFKGSVSGGHVAANSTTTTNGDNSLANVKCELDNKDIWEQFHSLNTEMIITKTGRRMFPVLKVQFSNLEPNARYAVSMSIVPVDNKRYRYAYHKSCWQVAGKADPSAEPRLYPHPDSPFQGDLLARQVISFEKVKLTNNEMDKSGHIILNSMHKYQPCVHLVKFSSKQSLSSSISPATTSKQQQQQQTSSLKQVELEHEGYRTWIFPQTVFTAVTAYQNQLITKMKIDKNPFAKGFRDSSRLSDLDRTSDPFDYMASAAHVHAAAASAFGVLDVSQQHHPHPHHHHPQQQQQPQPHHHHHHHHQQQQQVQQAQVAATQMWLAALQACLINGGAAAAAAAAAAGVPPTASSSCPPPEASQDTDGTNSPT